MRDAAVQSLAIGFFDGVHLGHQAILGGATAALTFRNHPLSVLAPDRAPRLIMSVEDRVAAIKSYGVKEVTVLEFTRELAEMPPMDFVAMLAQRFGGVLPAIRCGGNWRFGRGGVGGAEFLRGVGAQVHVASYAEYGGERISSTRVRCSLEAGEIEDANAMMGRRFKLRGERIGGKGLGRTIGYPTVNLNVCVADGGRVRLPLGVYAVESCGAMGVANLGIAPTMGENAWQNPVLEVHFLSGGTSCSLDEALAADEVEFVRYIRPERKFGSVDELKKQIADDCRKALS